MVCSQGMQGCRKSAAIARFGTMKALNICFKENVKIIIDDYVNSEPKSMGYPPSKQLVFARKHGVQLFPSSFGNARTIDSFELEQ